MDRLEAVFDQGIRQATYEYTPQGQLKNARSGLLESSYEYDANGNCVQKETLSGITRYAYDCMNRLSEASYPWGREQFTYDQADNRIQRVHTVYQMDKTACPDALDMQGSIKDMDAYGDQYASQKGDTYTDRYFYDERNRLVRAVLNEGLDKEGISREYAYDANGNLLNDGVNKYEYDAYNRMTEVRTSQGEVQVNRYDAEGLRHEMEENGRLVQFLYKGKEVVAEEGEKAGVVRYIRGLGLVSSDSEEARTYYHYASDELGSITHIVKAAVHKKLEEDGRADEGEKDESKGKDKDCQVLNRYAYDAFGNRVECEEQIENRFGFAGELYDPVSALVYLRARFYNPVIGRFLQEDNVYEDGLNLYVYCRNNPVRYVDPSGHGTESPADKNSGDTGSKNSKNGSNNHDSSFDNLNTSVSDLELPEGTWDEGPATRGKTIDDMYNNTGSNYPVIDKFEDGVATSVKSRDLNSKTYQNGSKLESVIKRDVDKLANFDGAKWGDTNIKPGETKSRKLLIVVPDVSLSDAQTKAINNAITYVNRKGVTIEIVVEK